MMPFPKLPDGRRLFVYDVEIFRNFFLACITDGERIWRFRESDFVKLNAFINDDGKAFGGFNSFSYDDIILREIYRKPTITTAELCELSGRIITAPKGAQDIFKLKYAQSPWAYSLDVFQMLNAKGSLKEWECKEGAENVMDSPADFALALPSEMIKDVTGYCENDARETANLFRKNWHLINIRHTLMTTYNLNERVYVETEAQVAEHALMSLHERRTGIRKSQARIVAKDNPENKTRLYSGRQIIFSNITFSTEPFKNCLNSLKDCNIRSVDAFGASWILPDEFKKPIQLGGKSYQLGVGGLHSVDPPGRFYTTENHAIIDLDVTSYYPSIIINHGLFPRHLGKGFLDDFKKLYDARLKAKSAGDKATSEALKIVINSTFGKLNDFYSPLRSIPDALRVTINGQLFLLMLAESIERIGGTILSANTDGVTISWPKKIPEATLESAIKSWEKLTGFNLERKDYKSYHRRDVNTYIAQSINGDVKYKGALNPRPDKGKWDGVIVKKAAEKYLLEGIDPEITIREEKDLTSFLYYQRCQNGGTLYHGPNHIGKTARWYVAFTGEQMYRKNKEGSKVKGSNLPNGGSARMAMSVKNLEIEDMEIDYLHYVFEAWDLIDATKAIP